LGDERKTLFILIFLDLQICEEDSSWQMKEGAIMGKYDRISIATVIVILSLD
jgi:hypothetical protein